MIYTLQKNSFGAVLAVAFLLLFLPFQSSAQSAVSFGVSPTIFDMTANPGQTWSSTIRIINSNPFDLTVTVEVAGFIPKGEGGTPQFVSLADETQTTTLARWITTQKEVNIPAEKTTELPFVITVPNDATPGGHYAALMISTRPAESVSEETKVQTSQVISSLVFLKVSGDINENSAIRSFRTPNYIVSKPETAFELRIENDGNVHVQPQGEIKIYNMWGQERGIVPINQQTLFGNVLPASVRKYSFMWEGDWSFSDIGRYTAVATMAYGVEKRQFMSADTAFWIIPWKIILGVLLVLGGLIALFSWALKLYIKRVLALSGVSLQKDVPVDTLGKKKILTKKQQLANAVAPIEISILDLRQKLQATHSIKNGVIVIVNFLRSYWLFFAVTIISITVLVLIAWFIKDAFVSERDYQVTVESGGKNVVISSEEVTESRKVDTVTVENVIGVILSNRSGDASVLNSARKKIEAVDIMVSATESDEQIIEQNTVIVYDPAHAAIALKLSKLFDNALLSAYEDETTTDKKITIYLGVDQIDGQ